MLLYGRPKSRTMVTYKIFLIPLKNKGVKTQKILYVSGSPISSAGTYKFQLIPVFSGMIYWYMKKTNIQLSKNNEPLIFYFIKIFNLRTIYNVFLVFFFKSGHDPGNDWNNSLSLLPPDCLTTDYKFNNIIYIYN